MTVTDAALARIISEYTRESGVRSLERQIGALLRNAADADCRGLRQARVTFDAADVDAVLGASRFENEVASRTRYRGSRPDSPGRRSGGDILFIESARLPGNGKLILTGQLGDVMKESAQAALSLVKSQAEELGIDPKIFENSDIHVHVPAGAIPKDGPSAGVAMFVSLASLLKREAVRPDVAMTGEISLRGLVLPVGGIKEKTIAAARAGIKRVILPARNRRDLEDIPQSTRDALRVRLGGAGRRRTLGCPGRRSACGRRVTARRSRDLWCGDAQGTIPPATADLRAPPLAFPFPFAGIAVRCGVTRTTIFPASGRPIHPAVLGPGLRREASPR